ncbi:MAG TPA: hypothetical protein VJ826_12150 [Candidatus Polarisedimenticolaceae bacterium]|nr:hypothetical protein [Candidatus Polarisedimenticolaceae bacterium]
MSLIARVLAALEAHGAKGALIGGSALAVHGVARSTLDMDVLTTDASVLQAPFAASLGLGAKIQRGDVDDPLVGVVRIEEGDEIVDVIVGGLSWMKAIVDRASAHRVPPDDVPTVEAADLILLKLYAGGPQDLLDVRLLVAARPEVAAVVEERIKALPREAQERWTNP